MHRAYFLVFLPVLAFFIIFSYFPMYGVVIAFKNFNFTKGILGSDWMKPLWFHFQLLDLTGEKVRIRLANSAQCLGSSWANNHPVYRFDGGEWERIADVEDSWTLWHCLETWFEIPLTGERMEFAFCYPYQEAHLMKTLRECPAFHMEIIGWSNHGRPIRRIANLPGDEARSLPGVYIIGRQHSGEVTGTWEIDGMLRYLSSPEGAKMRDRIAWWFVPFSDIDGVEEGCYGKDQVINDLNRAWHPHFPRRVELTAIQRDISLWNRATMGRFVLDMHGPGHCERESYFVIGGETPDAFREETRSMWTRLNAHLDAAGMQTTQFQEREPGDNTSAQSGMKCADYIQSLDINGSTFECTYQGERTGRSYTIEDYQRLGACMAMAITETYCPE